MIGFLERWSKKKRLTAKKKSDCAVPRMAAADDWLPAGFIFKKNEFLLKYRYFS
jgi:hypothetical protein